MVWKLSVGCVVLVIFGAHLADVDRRNAELRRFLLNNNDGLDRIVSNYGISTDQCSEHTNSDTYRLAAAFLTVETFATSRLESWTRYLIVNVATFVGVAPPNISVGPGRIRLKTARLALEHSALSNLEYYRRLPDDLLAKELLRSCASVQIATAILETLRRQHPQLADEINWEFIREATRIYNGQLGRPSSLDAAISGEIYFALVYQTFQRYRFMAL